MSNRALTFRLVLVFSICSIFLGYIVASPFDWTAFTVYAIVLLIFALPFLLRWHHALLILTWNMNAIVFLLPGGPPLWLLMVAMSLVFSVANLGLAGKERYLFVPSIVRPLLFLAAVVLATAFLKGGIGLNAFGGAVSGGKRYILVFGAICGYFALTSHRIAPEKAYLHGSAFFLGGGTAAIGNLLPLINPAFYVIFAIFPPEKSGFESMGLIDPSAIMRLGGLTLLGAAVFCAMLANYGIRGIFDLSNSMGVFPFRFQNGFSINNPWRMLLFFAVLLTSLFGGFRSIIVIFGLTFAIQFFYERLFYSRLFPTFLLLGILGMAALLPVANKLPMSMQRALSFLPVDVDPVARSSAEASSEWRLDMWRRLLPQVPDYFFLGKGYALDSRELAVISDSATRGQTDSVDIALLAGDYHNGPLSLIIPFGIFGLIGFCWFIIASIKVLSNNYHFGAPSLLKLNRFLLVYFIARTVYFFFIFGSLYSDLVLFAGIVGLSISINGGLKSNTSPVRLSESEAVIA